ncbi:MAG: radical SAM protein [Planctomycetota bacterium]|jgi:pyruvate formate lyase activating enzyme
MKEAMFYKRNDGDVKCNLCNQRCVIKEGNRGICGVRENKNGKLYSLVYGKSVSVGIDPIEKKPLFHLHPGSASFSIATVGCNFHCHNCQNWTISQMSKGKGGKIVGDELLPEEIVVNAKNRGCKSIAYTYTEPTIFFEYVYDTAKLAQKEGIKNVFVTNGYTSAAKTVHNIKGVWVEVTTLLIPGYNDDENQLKEIAEFIISIGEDIPWHITAFYPSFKLLDVSPTSVESLRKARDIGIRVGLRYVYEGNIPGEGRENTYCYGCGIPLIKRYGFEIMENNIIDGTCQKCKIKIDGIGL